MFVLWEGYNTASETVEGIIRSICHRNSFSRLRILALRNIKKGIFPCGVLDLYESKENLSGV